MNIDKNIFDFLNEKVDQYNTPDFIDSDPIQIPHQYNLKEDIEIASLLVATIAWGQRMSIINNGNKLMRLMNDEPHDFILKPLNIEVTVDGPIPTTLNLTISDNNLNGAIPLGSLEFLNILVGSIDMSAYGNYTISCQLTLVGDQNTGNDLSPDLLLENVVPVALPVQVPFTGFDGIDLSVAYPGWNESSSLQPVTGNSSWTASANLGAVNNITASFNYNLNNNVSYIVGPKVTAAFNTFVDRKSHV